MRLVLASNNARKLAELGAMLGGLKVQIVTQGELGITEAAEPHCTFIENGLAKARHAAAAANGPAIADDSGLCVAAMDGEPGVNSAHFASVALPHTRKGDREARRQVQDAANNAMLLQRLHGAADRSAQFVSTLVAVRHADDPEPLVACGRWSGTVVEQAQGEGGFGYDPLLFIPDLGMTAAQLPVDVKNVHSHRARAAAQMIKLLRARWHLG
ncbi:MAG: non-canonical purine NTP pyrophosphatase [Chitinophagaceae bacterium]|nr:non-canonical purine NTP pyrophosphatase [Rubrivivax sp.]